MLEKNKKTKIYTVKDKVIYVGGTQDGKLVKPSIVNACVADKTNKGCEHITPLWFEDYPMALEETYVDKIIKTDNNEEKLIFKLVSSQKVEIGGRR